MEHCEFRFSIKAVRCISYSGGHTVIQVETGAWKFSDESADGRIRHRVDIGGMFEDTMGTQSLYLHLTPSYFTELTREAWDGTAQDGWRLSRLLRGRTFRLPPMMRPENEVL